MGALSNPKHELFAQELAQGRGQAEAYQAAGYKPSEPHASRLASNGKVTARVAELQSVGATAAITTIESLLEAGWSIINAAKTKDDFGAASQTLERVAKIAGLWTDKAKLTVNTHEDALGALA